MANRKEERIPAASAVVRANTEPIRVLLAMSDAQQNQKFCSVLEAAGYGVWIASTIAEARERLSHASCDILLCDVCLQEEDGFALMQETLCLFPELPVILFAAQSTVELARKALYAGASDFLSLSFDPADLPMVVERNLTRRAVQNTQVLQQKMAQQVSHEAILDSLLSALDARDIETQGHCECVTAYTMELADRMELPSEALFHIERGALLHDIGKIAISDQILFKQGPLTSQEWLEIRKHPVIGFEMCSPIPMLQEAAQLVRHHHEWWNGSGYPDKLRGEHIPLGARLFAIADALDAITAGRPYRPAQPFAAAREEIYRCSGTQFDPALVQVFLSVPEARWEHIRMRAYRVE